MDDSLYKYKYDSTESNSAEHRFVTWYMYSVGGGVHVNGVSTAPGNNGAIYLVHTQNIAMGIKSLKD